jgi:hypothetical protein
LFPEGYGFERTGVEATDVFIEKIPVKEVTSMIHRMNIVILFFINPLLLLINGFIVNISLFHLNIGQR